jgi:CheY-like chemotaxis protein
MKILYVEDNSSFREIVNVVLRIQLKHEVAFAYDGKMAMQMLIAQPFDLIVTDVNMPNMDGNKFIEQLRELFPDMPVAVVTADPESFTLKAKVIGVFDKTHLTNLRALFENIICQNVKKS